MAEKVQDKKIQKAPPGKGPSGSSGSSGSSSSQKPHDKSQKSDPHSKKGNDSKKKW